MHCTDHSHVLPLYTTSPQSISLVNLELGDFHRRDTTDKPSTSQILPGSPRAWVGSHIWGWKQSWSCPCNPTNPSTTGGARRQQLPQEQRQGWRTSSTQEGKPRSGKPRHHLHSYSSHLLSPKADFCQEGWGQKEHVTQPAEQVIASSTFQAAPVPFQEIPFGSLIFTSNHCKLVLMLGVFFKYGFNAAFKAAGLHFREHTCALHSPLY